MRPLVNAVRRLTAWSAPLVRDVAAVPPFGHARAAALTRFAADDALPGERARVARHLAGCPACRRRHADTAALLAAARALAAGPARDAAGGVLVPPPAVLARVLAARAAGARHLLARDGAAPPVTPRAAERGAVCPLAAPPRAGAARAGARGRRARDPVSRAAVGAAAGLVLAAGVGAVASRAWSERRAPNTAARPASAAAETGDVVSAGRFGLLAGVAYAAEPGRAAAAAAGPAGGARTAGTPASGAPGAEGATRVFGERLRAGRWTYAIRPPGAPAGAFMIAELVRVPHESGAAWRLVNEYHAGGSVQADTALVGAEDLRPLRWAGAFNDSTHFAQVYAAGRVASVLTVSRRAPGAPAARRPLGDRPSDRVVVDRRTVEGPAPPGAAIAESVLPYVTQALPLAAGWRGVLVAEALSGRTAAGAETLAPVRARLTIWVEGAERVRVPAGVFDCWRVAAVSGGVRQTLWVRRADGHPVRLALRRAVPTPSSDLDVALVREAPALAPGVRAPRGNAAGRELPPSDRSIP